MLLARLAGNGFRGLIALHIAVCLQLEHARKITDLDERCNQHTTANSNIGCNFYANPAAALGSIDRTSPGGCNPRRKNSRPP
jgi:hypothetical protein